MSMSIREYSRTRSADRNSVRHAIATGLILIDDDGRIADPAQADRDWGSIRRAPYLGARLTTRMAEQDSEAATRSAKAKVAIALGRLRLVRQKVDTMRERYVDRTEAVAVGEREAVYVIDALRGSPAAYAPTLAAEMGIPDETARRILDRFIGLTLVEIGDLPRQAIRDAERGGIGVRPGRRQMATSATSALPATGGVRPLPLSKRQRAGFTFTRTGLWTGME
jgi:hypothetical protein